MDSGRYAFVLDIPPDFERDVQRGRQPNIQVNIDAATIRQAGTALYLFFRMSLGIFLATLARSMPQFGLLFIMVALPMTLLSGGTYDDSAYFLMKIAIDEGIPTYAGG